MGWKARRAVDGRANAEARSDRAMPLGIHQVSSKSHSIASSRAFGIPLQHFEDVGVCSDGEWRGEASVVEAVERSKS